MTNPHDSLPALPEPLTASMGYSPEYARGVNECIELLKQRDVLWQAKLDAALAQRGEAVSRPTYSSADAVAWRFYIEDDDRWTGWSSEHGFKDLMESYGKCNRVEYAYAAPPCPVVSLPDATHWLDDDTGEVMPAGSNPNNPPDGYTALCSRATFGAQGTHDLGQFRDYIIAARDRAIDDERCYKPPCSIEEREALEHAQAEIAEADRLLAIIDSSPAPQATVDLSALEDAYFRGWRRAAIWAGRLDLISDSGSVAYLNDRDEDLDRVTTEPAR